MSTSYGDVQGRASADPADQGPGLTDRLHVNRFGGGADGVCVQLTIRGHYVQLDRAGVEDLRDRLAKVYAP